MYRIAGFPVIAIGVALDPIPPVSAVLPVPVRLVVSGGLMAGGEDSSFTRCLEPDSSPVIPLTFSRSVGESRWVWVSLGEANLALLG